MKDPTDSTTPSSETSTTYRRPGRVTLRVVSGPGAGQTIAIPKERIVVGRSRTADLTLDHPSVSAVHFELRIGEHGVDIRDLNSTNGTRIGPLSVFFASVPPGTVISAGDCDVRIEAVDDVDARIVPEGRLGAMVGSSPVMRETFAKLRSLAKMPLDVLVTGETGTGKELACRAIHELSACRGGPLVTLDCGTLARSLTEAAIFGHSKSAFTGSESDTPGFVERANDGTLFIDEIGELPLDLQVKLLRVLDRREVTRLGETRPRTVDMRVVAATNRDLDKMVAEGHFREDLFFRLSHARVELPPLRRRGDDVIGLAEWFAQQVSQLRGLPILISESAKNALRQHSWPGNVRELFNVIQYAAHMTESGVITSSSIVLGSPVSKQEVDFLCSLPYKQAHIEFDKVYLSRALQRARGSAAACSRQIDLPRTSLRRRLRDYDIRYIDDLDD
ncbi:MAG: sigma 54-interacting transcriptional regulator [Nannocystaceae bacterium]